MVNKKEEEQNTGKIPCTKEQITLIKELYSELDYPKSRRYTNDTLELLDKKIAANHIEALIRIKRMDKNGNGNQQNGFDKIAYCMIYKLVYRDWDKLSSQAMASSMHFEEWVQYEYTKFKKAQAFAEKTTNGGGQHE